MSRDATRRRHQARVPAPGPRAAPRHQPRPGGRGAVQGDHRRLRGALRPGEAAALRPLRRRGARRRPVRLRRRRASTTSSTPSSAAAAPSAAAAAAARPGRRGVRTSRWSPTSPSRRRCSAPATRSSVRTAVACDDLRGHRRQAGHAADHLPRVRRRRPGAAGAPELPRPDGHQLDLPALRRPGPGDQRPVPDLPRRGAHRGGAQLHRRHPRRRRHRLHAPPERPRRGRPARRRPRRPVRARARAARTSASPATASTSTASCPISFTPGDARRPPRVRHARRHRGPRDPARHPVGQGVPAARARRAPPRAPLARRPHRAGGGRRAHRPRRRRRRSCCGSSPSVAATRWRPPTPGSCPASARPSAERRAVAAHPADHPGPFALVADLDAPALDAGRRPPPRSACCACEPATRSCSATARGAGGPARFGDPLEPTGADRVGAAPASPPSRWRSRS